MAFAAEPGITDLSMHDERSAAFLAIGAARATGRPVVITCTSGTAAAEFHPAVAEASASRVPLIVLTADRPGELFDLGAPQTIDQTHLYGRAVRWSHDLEAPDASDVSDRAVAAIGSRLVAEATRFAPGPVHLNCRFREPLVPTGAPPGALPSVTTLPGRPLPTSDQVEAIAAALAGRRGLIVCGPQDDPALAPAVAAFATASSTPVLADPLSGLRYGPHDRTAILAGGDLLAAGGFLDTHPPEVILRIGGLPTSKPLWSWMEAHADVDQILVDVAGWRDPLATASTVVFADPAAVVAGAVGGAAAPAGWLDEWTAADIAARVASDRVVEAAGRLSEPLIARLVSRSVVADADVWIASSMPIRDVDTFGVTRDEPARSFGHRGANGIDGLLSAAAGTAIAGGRPTYALAGDLSTLHDLTAIAAAVRLGADLTAVVINNDGGGIFHYLPQVDFPKVFERHFGTPHGLDFASIAAPLGAATSRVDDADELGARLGTRPSGVDVIEVVTDRGAERELHRDVRRAVHAALAGS
jgi:2-succinyl-5-enolpyruvyl-6-hydroxy-3-cyclohexene-1-carboxylate synthase